MNNLGNYLKLMNLDRTQTIVSSLLLGFALGVRSFPAFIIQAVPLIVSSILIYGAGAILNNISDAAFDGKDNPIRSGAIPKQNALALALLLAFAGLVIVSLYGFVALVIGLVMTAAGIFYSYFLRIKDRVWCAPFLAFTHHLGPLVLGYYVVRHVISTELVLFAISIYVVMAGIILVKDFKDIDRDIKEGRRNLAILLGPAKTSRIVLLSSFLYLFLVFVLVYYSGIANAILSLMLIGGALGIVALSLFLVRTPTIETGKLLISGYRKFVSLSFMFWSLALAL